MTVTMTNTKSGSARLADLLTEMNTTGQFLLSLLADKHGFLIAAATAPGETAEYQSAVVALVQKTAIQVHQQLGLAPTDEITLNDAKGQRLICRPFSANGYEMILAVLVPGREQSYRRLTNKAIGEIKQVWKL
ncbi:MAG: hypothetical protein KA314_02330 [Chloroflexi bacterium]|nr:hypothetical protein [Chloroflexota bacterium]MBP8054646.1 hypothetical protein [Chloroflexota bacterium]